MAYLLDSNILIYFFKNTGAVRAHVAKQKDIDMHLCTPVVWELLTGAYKSDYLRSQLTQLEAVKNRFQLLHFDLNSAEKAAETRVYLEKQGTPIGNIDTLIAGIALAHNLTLVTRNTREFERIPGLRIENWYD